MEFLNINNGQRILEIGCGTGTAFREIVRRDPDGKNPGIDLSLDVLEKAEHKLRKLDGVDFMLKKGDILSLGLPDRSFDRLICNSVVGLMPQETFDKIASEFYRLLDSNALVVISTFSLGTSKSYRFWYWLAKKMSDLLTGCRPVSFKVYLSDAGFVIEEEVQISQNTFPSEVIRARKPR